MASQAYSTSTAAVVIATRAVGAWRASDAATLMLARLFPRRNGDAQEPALPPPPRPNRPAPAAAAQRVLVEA